MPVAGRVPGLFIIHAVLLELESPAAYRALSDVRASCARELLLYCSGLPQGIAPLRRLKNSGYSSS